MRRNIGKRLLSGILSLVLVLSLVPAVSLVQEAAAAPTGDTEYITLPITIRDFAADGMLFEYNEVNVKTEEGSPTGGNSSVNINIEVNTAYSGDIIYGYAYTYDQYTTHSGINKWWLNIYVNADGSINRVYKSGQDVTDSTIPVDGMMISFHEELSENYAYMNNITEGNKDTYTLSLAPHPDNSAYYVLVVTQTGDAFHQADTQAFGLLATDANDYLNVLGSDTTGVMSDTIYGSVLFSNGTWNGTSTPTAVESNLYSSTDRTTPYATQTIYGARVRTNLVDKDLDENGKPVYTPETVAFLANFMEDIMAVEWENADGSFNTYHVEGVKLFDANMEYVGPNLPEAVYDLADILRMSVNGSSATDKLGTYAASRTKFQNGLLEYPIQVETWFDAAYYLLHYTWRDSYKDNLTGQEGRDGYGMPISQYNQIHLIKTTNDNNQPCYVFNARYDDTVYNIQKGEIYNTQLTEFTQAENSANQPAYVYGNPLPVARFDPLGLSGAKVDLGYGMSGNTYADMTGAEIDWGTYYNNTNYNMTLEGNAQFVYHKGEGQYFMFTGDDDVYLYINGVRVLDIGGAHSISKVRVDLDEVAEVCGMEDEGNYHFDFFYMERHGTASNFGIETNIELAVPSINTVKTGYQDGVATGFNGPVNPSKHVGYSFELQNIGTADIFNLTFDDPAIGVKFAWNQIQLYPDDFTDEQKKLYDISHLYMIKYNASGTIIEYLRPGQVTEDILKDRLSAGLKPDERIGIYGFKYMIPEEEWVPVYKLDANGQQVIGTDGKPVVETYYFPNTVSTSATNSRTEVVPTLFGIDDWRVRQMDLVFTPFHVYNWVNKDLSRNPLTVNDWRSADKAGLPLNQGVTVTKEELLQYLIDANVEIPADRSQISIVVCNAAGREDEASQNKNVTLNADGSITYKSTENAATGSDTVYYKVQWNGNTYNQTVFNYDVFTYGTVNDIFVLDYGLSVELAHPRFTFQNNDVTSIDQNKRTMVSSLECMVDNNGNAITSKTGTYGDFTWTNLVDEEYGSHDTIIYTPTKIINNTDYVLAKVRIVEEGKTFSKFTGVEMVQKITTAPASIVYYEENFPGITYVNNGDDQWVHYETVDSEGNSVAGNFQSPDQDMNYGSDPNYAEDKVGTITSKDGVGTVIDSTTLKIDNSSLAAIQATGIEALNKYLGLGGSDSNGSVNELVIHQAVQKTDENGNPIFDSNNKPVMEEMSIQEVMFFEFTGTGFEIVSRTTDDIYALVNVDVQRKETVQNADGTETVQYRTVRYFPVVTESIGGDLYQVPIISVAGLERAEYRVALKVVLNPLVERVLYIDGVRIYGPLSDTEALEYYNPEEFRAEVHEVKQLIEDGQVICTDASRDENGNLKMVVGSIMIEDVEDYAVLTAIDDINQYMTDGPNNELYLDPASTNALIAFFITPNEDVPEAERTLEIGAHRKSDSEWEDTTPVYLVYGSTAQDIVDRTYKTTVSSGTEMYYTIDVNNLEKDSAGRYLVMVGTNRTAWNDGEGEDWGMTTLALTNLKVAGYNVSFAQTALMAAYNAGNLRSLSLFSEPMAVYNPPAESEVPQEPDIEEIIPDEEIIIPEEPEITLVIHSAALKADSVVSGKTATLTVKTSEEAASIVVTDAEGNVIQPGRQMMRTEDGNIVFTFMWTVSGVRGEKLTYTIRAYDANGNASANTATVTVTIK